MARSSRAPHETSVALELLSADHRKVESLFMDFERMKEEDDDSRVAIAQRICSELAIHAQVEEMLFYPWLRDKLDEPDLVEEAKVEHESLKALIAQIEPAGGPDDAYDAKVKVLAEYVKHHVKEEEGEIFPQVAGHADELDELGQEMHALKADLREEAGMSSEKESEQAPGALVAARRSAQEDTARRSR